MFEPAFMQNWVSNKKLGDRTVLVAPLIDSAYLASLINSQVRNLYDKDFLWPGGQKNARAQIKGFKCHGYDGVLVGSQCKYGRRKVLRKDGHNLILKDEYGGISKAPPNERPYLIEPALTKKENLNTLSIPDFKDGRLDHIDLVLEEIGEKAIVIGGVPEGPFSFSAYLRGPQNFMRDLHEDIDFVHDILDFATNVSLQMVESLARKNVDVIWVGDGFASGSMISPWDYRRFALPFVRRVINKIHGEQLPAIYHICGKVADRIELIEKTGTDIFEIDSEENAGCSLDEALSKLNAMIIKGNLDPTKLISWDKEEVYRECEEIIQKAERYPNFILSTGCFLPYGVPPENVDEMVKAT